MRIRTDDLDAIDELPSREHIVRTPKSEHRVPHRPTVKRKHLYGAARKLKEYREREN